jgi:hypothetical protein
MDDFVPTRSERDRSRPQSLLPPPAPDLGPTIFGRQMTRREKWIKRVVALSVFNWVTILGLLAAMDSDFNIGQRTAGVFAAATFLTMSIVSIRIAERRRLRAGEDWLSGGDGDEYVRLDQLQRVKVYRHSGASDYVSFLDDNEREVHFAVDVLATNPRLRQIVLQAIDDNERRGRKVYSTPRDRAQLLKSSEPYGFARDSDTEF